MKKKIFLFIILFNSFLSCNNEDDKIIELPISNIEEEFIPFVNSFYNNMETRGLNRKNNLSVVFVDQITAPNSEGFCGYGYTNFNNTGKPRVEIINSDGCWYLQTEIQKENFIYHELGHALLARGHTNGFFPNGSPRSIMCGDGTCNNYRIYNEYQIEQKNYYLDELANSQNIVPDWAEEKVFVRNLYEDNFDTSIQGWETSINNVSNSNPYTFYISTENVFSTPNAIAISSINHSDTEASGSWYKDFTVSDFDSCSNMIVRSNIITENLSSGFVALIVDLYDHNTERFARYFNTILDNTTGIVSYENFEAKLICIPQETDFIRVQFFYKTQIEASVYMDDLNIELYE